MCPLFSLSSFRAATFAVVLVPVISPFTIFVSHYASDSGLSNVFVIALNIP